MNSLDDLKRKEYIDSPQYWARQHIIGKAYNVDKYTLNRFIEALEWQITEYEQLQSKLDKACEALERISKTIDCGCNPCRGQCDSVIALKIYIEEIQGCANQALTEIRKKDDNG